MSDILDRIVAAKREEIAARRLKVTDSELRASMDHAPPARDFRAALVNAHGLALIAEVKKASPSAGILRADFDPVVIARLFANHGAHALSVLTDTPFFQGSLDSLTAVHREVTIPVLRKDFILDPYQVYEARVAGADAVLLIAEILGNQELPRLVRLTHELGMEALVELYEPDNLPRILASGARVIGVNNRNLRTFVTNLDHTLAIAPRVPKEICLVSESGIQTRADLTCLANAGVKAVLIGETFMRATDISAKINELFA